MIGWLRHRPEAEPGPTPEFLERLAGIVFRARGVAYDPASRRHVCAAGSSTITGDQAARLMRFQGEPSCDE